MSIKAKAVRVVNEAYADEYVAPHMTPLKVVQALADAGLLAPEIREPYAKGMTSGPRSIGDIDHPEAPFALFEVCDHPDGAAAYGDRVEITHTIVPDQRGYTPRQARDLAAALLSAASCAEDQVTEP